MSSEPSTVPPALQARSRVTQDRIFTAGTRLLQEGGPEALTVAAVAAAAGIAVGSVYRRFGDKERLLGAIQARFTEDFRAEFRWRLADTGLTAAAPPAQVIGATVTGMAETFRAHAPLLRVFMLLGTQNPAVLEEGSKASIEGGRTFRDTVMLAAPALRHHPDVETAIDAIEAAMSWWMHRLEDLIAAGIEPGQLTPCDPAQLAFEIQALLNAGGHDYRLYHDPKAPARTRTAIRQRLEHFRGPRFPALPE